MVYRLGRFHHESVRTSHNSDRNPEKDSTIGGDTPYALHQARPFDGHHGWELAGGTTATMHLLAKRALRGDCHKN